MSRSAQVLLTSLLLVAVVAAIFITTLRPERSSQESAPPPTGSAETFSATPAPGSGQDGLEAPVDLPAPSTRPEMEDFLAGPGTDLVAFHELSQPLSRLRGDPSLDRPVCEQVAEALDAGVGSPPDLFSLAERVAGAPLLDEVSAEVLVNDLTVKFELLQSCYADARTPLMELVTEVSFTHQVVAQRFLQLQQGSR